MNIRLADIGANLSNKAFDHDRDAVIDRAIAAGVDRIIVTASSLRSAGEARAIALTRPGKLYSTAGVHPHDAHSCDDGTIASIRAFALDPLVVAVGECGLDFNRDFSPRQEQEQWFEAQVSLACEIGKPLFLHERDAHARFLAILSNFRGKLPRTVVHCFTGTADEIRAYIEAGYYIGITGWICDERRGIHLREIIRSVPHDRLMIETDAPYLFPRTIRPKPKASRNEPSFLPYVLDMVAECTGRTREETARDTYETTLRFFNIG